MVPAGSAELAATAGLVTSLGAMGWAWVLARSQRSARSAIEEQLRRQEELQDAHAWMAIMKESAANMAEALGQASRFAQFSRSTNTLDEDTLKRVGRRFLPLLFEAERFSIFRYRVHRRQLVLFTHNHPEWDEWIEPLVVPADTGNGIMAAAISTRAPVTVDRFADSRFADKDNLSRYPDGPAVCIPLVVSGQVIGVMNLNGLRVDRITTNYLAVIRQAADHFALALYNTDLVARMNEQAVRDPLTGLYNRRHYYLLANQMADQARQRGEPFSLLLADLDGFKDVNDTWGHATGDRMLKAVAESLRTSVRRTDVACRIGGDEFVALLGGATRAEASEMARRLVASVGGLRLLAEDGRPVRLGVSVGVAEYRIGEGHTALLHRADGALYEAKRRGRNNWVTADEHDPATGLAGPVA